MVEGIDVTKLAEIWPIVLVLGLVLALGAPLVGLRLAKEIGTDDQRGLLYPRNLLRYVALCFATLAFAVGVVVLSVLAILYTMGELTPSVGMIPEPTPEHREKVDEQ